MSASEKLKALMVDFPDNDIHGEPLLMALPQIVAVVEAAEVAQIELASWLPSTSSEKLRYGLDAALAALDEALS